MNVDVNVGIIFFRSTAILSNLYFSTGKRVPLAHSSLSMMSFENKILFKARESAKIQLSGLAASIRPIVRIPLNP